jgi:uncharacterized protein YndB with AHSA1/START domain
MSEQAETLAVRKTVTVNAPPERASAAFTEEISRWWPLATHHIGAQAPVEAIIEPRAGGRWFERAGDGSECDSGRVVAWEPPRRLGRHPRDLRDRRGGGVLIFQAIGPSR